jgi:antibiotic biosynthesis monooxygenase (ABM) superfamily enzyme
MAIATFIGAYIVTAIAIPLETRWVPHSWSCYETNIITAVAMTWAIMPGLSRLLRGWLYASRDGTPVPVPAVARPPWQRHGGQTW